MNHFLILFNFCFSEKKDNHFGDSFENNSTANLNHTTEETLGKKIFEQREKIQYLFRLGGQFKTIKNVFK